MHLPSWLLRSAMAVAGVLVAASAIAQTSAPAFRPPTTNSRAVLEQRIAATDVTVDYGRPCVRGREIFGALVPWDRVWRTGSDAATKISFSTPVTFAGVHVEAGDYELFSIPGHDAWTVILQPARRQWGSYAYDPANDAARVDAVPQSLRDPVETFTIGFDDVDHAAATLAIAWDRVRVPVRIEIDVRETVVPRLEAALHGEGRRPYFQAAMFYYENDLDLDRAAELMALALEQNPGHIGMLHRQALILAKKGDREGAIAAAEASLAGARGAGPELEAEYTRLNEDLLERLRE